VYSHADSAAPAVIGAVGRHFETGLPNERKGRMMTKALLPQVFWFRMTAPCARVEGIPRSADPLRLLDLPEACALPDWCQLEGLASWAKVRVGWNARGLGITVLAEGISDQQLVRDRPEGFALAQFWIDTRDSRNVSRATRFCHRFVARLDMAKTKRQLVVDVAQRPIERAQVDAPICRPGLIESRVELGKSGWVLELFLPVQVLNGFDPDTNRRLGFAYKIGDHVREDQYLGVGREFPVGENPSLWATLELRN
jgi:hypothetical protein